MTERAFENLITDAANTGATVYPSGVRAKGTEPFSATAWKGINSYEGTLAGTKHAGRSKVNLATKTPNVR